MSSSTRRMDISQELVPFFFGSEGYNLLLKKAGEVGGQSESLCEFFCL